jgi:hypothetical protein
MGDCKFCGKPAGLLKSQHKECRQKHDTAAGKLRDFFVKALDSPIEAARFRQLADAVARENYIQEPEFRKLTSSGLSSMIDHAFRDHVLTEAENKRIVALCNVFAVTANDLGDAGQKLAKAQILRQLDEGQLPSNIEIQGMPINLESGEVAIWLFNGVTYYTTRSRTHYVGGSHSVSIRLMKGVYYRVGAFRGEPVKTQYLSEEGRGIFVIASKNIYFWSPQKALKIRPKKIISVQPYSDAIQIMRDGSNATPQLFALDDPPFAADLISRLNQL